MSRTVVTPRTDVNALPFLANETSFGKAYAFPSNDHFGKRGSRSPFPIGKSLDHSGRHCGASICVSNGYRARQAAKDRLRLISQSGGIHSVSACSFRLSDVRCLNSQCCSRQTRPSMPHNFLLATDNPTVSLPPICLPASPAYGRWQLGKYVHPSEIIRIFLQ
jgi:hypothetical protein